MLARFRLYNITMGEHIAVIEMDDSLLAPEAGILDHETTTLRPLKNGASFTLIPLEDHTVVTLERVKEAFDNIKKGADFFSTHLNRVDQLIETVGLLFGDVTYIVVETKDDIDKLVNPPRRGDWEPKKVKYNVLGDMLTKAKKDAEPKQADADAGHVHGPGCGHNHGPNDE